MDGTNRTGVPALVGEEPTPMSLRHSPKNLDQYTSTEFFTDWDFPHFEGRRISGMVPIDRAYPY